jgi:hypothetical protein
MALKVVGVQSEAGASARGGPWHDQVHRTGQMISQSIHRQRTFVRNHCRRPCSQPSDVQVFERGMGKLRQPIDAMRHTQKTPRHDLISQKGSAKPSRLSLRSLEVAGLRSGKNLESLMVRRWYGSHVLCANS